ncbi:MAG: hypothetical protein ABI897_07955, partial [Spartobacteria bacterium]
MTRKLRAAALFAIALLLVPTARAKVVSESATGFLVTQEVDVAVDPKAAYDGFIQIGRWWNDDH